MFDPGERFERIRQRAYELWEEAGRPRGRDAEHWLQAEREFPWVDGPENETAQPNVSEDARIKER